MNTHDLVKQLIEDAGGKVTEMGQAPDGSGFATASFPLPADHWIYATTVDGFYPPPPMGLRMPGNDSRRQQLADLVREAVRYGVRAATVGGTEMDFDPDALVQNVIVGLFGYHTPTGLSEDFWANPSTPPPPCQWYHFGEPRLSVGDHVVIDGEVLELTAIADDDGEARPTGPARTLTLRPVDVPDERPHKDDEPCG